MRRSSPSLRRIGAVALWLASVSGVAWAHDNVVVHRGLAVQSFYILNNSFYTQPNKDDAREGSYDEDVPPTRSLGHFYNPVTDSAPWFALGAGPATDNCYDQYSDALSTYAANQRSGTDGAFHHLGRALHFIQDMTSPAHTHDDQHASDPEDFEDWGPSNFPSFDFTGVVPKFASPPTPEEFVRETAQIVYDLTAYQAGLDEVAGQQQPSVFRDMFPSLHWDDGGFFGDSFWEVDRIGRFEDFWSADGWWMLDETLIEDSGGRNGSRRLRGNAYVENTGGNSAEPVPVVYAGVPNTAGETMLQLYGRYLYREAVAYSAGLLQVFADAVGPTRTPTSDATSTPTPTVVGDTPTPTETPTALTPTPSVTPTPTGPTATPTVTATPTPLCGATPRSDCRRPSNDGISTLIVKDRTRDTLVWRWTKGDATMEELGNPVSGGTSYGLCIYDESGGVPSLATKAIIPTGGTCNGQPCWSARNSVLRYHDPSAAHDGIARAILKAGAASGARLIVRGKGTVPLPNLPLQQDVKVVAQFVSTTGTCWSAEYSTPATRSDDTTFLDRGR